ncbi:NmrA domain-containing protein [Mycena venus]|uniref:NmrA domain-containing protein n=1 Tax=Mycena venus TaxID=2733690 RepID=A0A8H6Y4C0_9AGAR|nr:NmrA domain-containing protein [Mycena venus]
MGSSRIVAIFGATGLQGSAVARELLKDGTFTPRAITRNPGSEAALKLKEEGIEVVKGDALDKASLVEALRGSEAVTVPIFPLQAEGEGPNEIVQGKNMVDAAKEAGVQFFIFTSLPDMTKLSGGKYKNVVYFDQKAVVEEYLRSSGLKNVSLHLGMFLENYWLFGWLKKMASGKFNLTVPNLPTDKAAFTWVERDIPAVVRALLNNYSDSTKNISGKVYPIVSGNISYCELAALTGNVLSAEVTFHTAPPFGVTALDEMYKAFGEFDGILPATPVADFEALGVKTGTIQEFLKTKVKPRFE